MEALEFAPGEREAFQRVWSWSFRRMVEGMTNCQDQSLDEYDPKPDVERLSDSILEFIVEQGSGCPFGYLAGIEKTKREGRIVDWKFDSFDAEGRVNTSLVLKKPLEYISFSCEVGSLETK